MMHWQRLLLIAVLLSSISGAALYYRAQYLDVEQSRQRIEAQAASRQAEIEQLNHQIQTVTALDRQHTRELENDKKRIAQLERDVADGHRRLQVRGTCPAVPTGSPPPAWMMQPAPDLLTPLNEIISPSDDGSK